MVRRVRIDALEQRALTLDKLRVAWISTEPLDRTPRGWTSERASLRYRMTIPSAALERLGCDSDILYLGPIKNRRAILARLEGAHAAIIGKLMMPAPQLEKEAPALLQFVADLGARGTKVLADFSDDSFGFPVRGAVDRSLANVADAVVASTPALADLMRTQTPVPVFTVTDPVEGERGKVRVGWGQQGGSRLKLLWFGHWTNFSTLRLAWDQLEPLAREGRIALTAISTPGRERELPVAELDARWRQFGSSCLFRPWSLSAVFDGLRECDAVVIPSDPGDRQKLVKSPNRFAESVWAGRFVAAHPLPAYQAFSEAGWVGKDLGEGVRWLLECPAEAAARVRVGQELVAASHAPDVVGNAWKNTVEAVLAT
jgi:hypothetical protein